MQLFACCKLLIFNQVDNLIFKTIYFVDPRSSADLQEIMKEFANTAQQDMVQPILTSMHRQSTEVKYEFDTVGEEKGDFFVHFY